MAESYCAGNIANLEGWRGIPLPVGDAMRVGLEDLDRRLRRLEIRERITPPPPMEKPTWDSLSWRVCRLGSAWISAPIAVFTPPHITPTMTLLRSTVASIPTQLQLPFPDKEDLDEKELMGRVGQWLCYIAGQRRIKIADITFELKSVCRIALDLSLQAEQFTGPPAPLGARAPIFPRGPGPRPSQPRKLCCGCCSCSCHPNDNKKSKSRSRSSSVSSDGSWRSRRKTGKMAKIGGWFRKLAFWKRQPKRNSDYSDDDSSSMSTLAE